MTINSAKRSAKFLHDNPFFSNALSSVNSYLGMIRYSDSFNIRKEICEIAIIENIIDCDDEYTKVFYR